MEQRLNQIERRLAEIEIKLSVLLNMEAEEKTAPPFPPTPDHAKTIELIMEHAGTNNLTETLAMLKAYKSLAEDYRAIMATGKMKDRAGNMQTVCFMPKSPSYQRVCREIREMKSSGIAVPKSVESFIEHFGHPAF